MKKKIVIGSIFVVCILMMVPSISAVEFSNVREIQKADIITFIKNIDQKELNELLKKLTKDDSWLKNEKFDEISDSNQSLSELLYNIILYYIWFRFGISSAINSFSPSLFMKFRRVTWFAKLVIWVILSIPMNRIING